MVVRCCVALPLHVVDNRPTRNRKHGTTACPESLPGRAVAGSWLAVGKPDGHVEKERVSRSVVVDNGLDRFISTTVKGFVPTINPLYLDTLQECIGEDLTLEVVAPPTGYDSASPDYDETLTAVSESENITLYESDSVPEYALGIVDNTVLLGTFDDRMRTHSVLAAPAQLPLREWATEQFTKIKPTATPY